MNEDEAKLLKELDKARTLVLVNKSDKQTRLDLSSLDFSFLRVSALTGEGLEGLKAEILKWILREVPSEESTVSLNARHFNHLTQAEKMLGDSLTLMVNDESPDLVALDLHGALREIYSILGEVYDDQVMDQVFNQFCIGK